MSFKRFDPEDFLVSGDSIVGPCWSNDSPVAPGLTVINSGISANYYKTGGNGGVPQFSVAVGIKADAVEERDVTYRQFANIILGDSDSTFKIAGADAVTASFLTIERARFKSSIFPPSFRISGSSTNKSVVGAADDLVSDANLQNTVQFNNAGRVFNLIPSGAADASGAKGLLCPDIGVAVLGIVPSGGFSDGNVTTLGGHLTTNSEETITSTYAFVRARNSEFNYSQNPTFIDSSTGGVRYTDFINAPQTFITTVGLYNDNNDLLATAKLSKPLKKDFTKEALIRIKLDF
tara:strand:+ start:717 stop:1589 length:873 start_codon:yes stop_codon:yes gene_type:complete